MQDPGGNRLHRTRSRAAIAAGCLLALAAGLSACGGGSSSDSNEPAGTYPVKVVEASFPAKQRLGQTSLMKLGVKNVGKRAVPALTVTVTIAGKQGKASPIPFGFRDPQPGLAQPERPVWVLAEHYPKLDGSEKPGGAETTSPTTFDFGRLEPGKTVDGVWKVSASRAGGYTVLYGIDAGLSGEAKAKTPSGVAPGGSFVVHISSQVPETTVNDSGEVVEVDRSR